MQENASQWQSRLTTVTCSGAGAGTRAGQGLVGLQTWVAVLRKIWPVQCDPEGQELLCVSPPEPLAEESPSEFLKPAPKTELFCLPVATGMDFPRAYLGRLPVSLPLVPGTGPLVMLQETAKARQGGWPTSSLHVNVPGSVFCFFVFFFLALTSSTFPEGVGEKMLLASTGTGHVGLPSLFAFLP